MTFKTAAYKILQNNEKPLTAGEITEIALKKGLINTESETPKSTMAAQLYTDINKKSEESKFKKVDKGLFGLRRWSKEDMDLEEDTIKTQNIDTVIDRLKERQFKSSSPTEFEKTLKNAFLFLGFEGELIGGSGDTDVLLSANIGKKSFKVNVDGKTSKNGKIIDRQIDWDSLDDHKNKNNANFVVVVGPDFAAGNLKKRAESHNITLLKTGELIELLSAHKKFPFTLIELKDLFAGNGDVGPQLEDLITQNHARVNLLEQFRTIVEEIQAIQNSLGYFTSDGLASRESIEEIEIEIEEIEDMIDLLELPFINGIEEVSENKYILTLTTKDISNIFQEISNLLVGDAAREELVEEHEISKTTKPKNEEKLGTKYFDWAIKGHSVVAKARKGDPYDHYCPIRHFKSIAKQILNKFKKSNVLGVKEIHESLQGKNLADNRPYKGKAEVYKIRVCFGIMELENILKWTGSKRPVEYKLNTSPEKARKWLEDNIKK